MLTGLYPIRHTVRDNGFLPLPASAQTVAEIAQDAGLRTAAFVGASVLSSSFGLDQGFDVYDDDFHKKRWGFIKSERDADEVTSIALELLRTRDADKPLFAWFHYSDPHAPYKRQRKFEVVDIPSKFRDEAGNTSAKYGK